MKKKILRIMVIATIVGGILVRANVANCKSRRISGNDCI